MRLAFSLALAVSVLLPASAGAAPSRKKAIWGPAEVNGVPQFPIYADLGVGIYQTVLRWSQVAGTRPRRPRDPSDPAYRWPAEIDYAIGEARRHGISVAVQVSGSPRWANGRRPPAWAPTRPGDFASFVTAAARRYPAIHHWMIWGEPLRRKTFRPLRADSREGPRRYAGILDAAYVALKRVNRRNLVIGGNTSTVGTIPPLRYIRWLRLRNGRPPRMDLFGHNAFTVREPDLSQPPLASGNADFSDLDTLAAAIDRNLRRGRRRPRIFVSEFTLPSDHPNRQFNFYVSRRTQARWLARALRIVRRWPRIYSFGWIDLYDEPPNGPGGKPGDEVNWGLLDWRGRRKPSYAAYRDG